MELAHRSEPPTKVKMLVRDFIHDSLYNVRYPALQNHDRISVVLFI